MKTSLTHLPLRKRDDLKRLVEAILEGLYNCEMIILYGSYARGNYVDLDFRDDFGIRTTFRSDYDILVLTRQDLAHHPGSLVDNILEKVSKCHYQSQYAVPVHFLHMGINTMNRYLSEGRYFYTDIKREGIMLYNSKNYKLARRRKLYYDEIGRMAQEYYDDWFNRGCNFYKGASFFYNDLKEYRLASFMLHQACECLISAIHMVFTLDKPKEHNLEMLIKLTKQYTQEVFYTFRQETEEAIRLFKLLKAAYIQARYNPKFKVTPEDIDALSPIVEQLVQVATEICRDRLEFYQQMGHHKPPPGQQIPPTEPLYEE